MTTNFKYPLTITGVQYGLIPLISKLKNIGYDLVPLDNWEDCPHLATKVFQVPLYLSNIGNTGKENYGRTIMSLSDYSEECILAIAAVREDGEFQVGEYLKHIKTGSIEKFKSDDITSIVQVTSVSEELARNILKQLYCRPTIEELIAHFQSLKKKIPTGWKVGDFIKKKCGETAHEIIKNGDHYLVDGTPYATGDINRNIKDGTWAICNANAVPEKIKMGVATFIRQPCTSSENKENTKINNAYLNLLPEHKNMVQCIYCDAVLKFDPEQALQFAIDKVTAFINLTK